MKITLDVPDEVFREAKVKAAACGIPLRRFITEALQEKLVAEAGHGDKPWMKAFGGLSHLHEENVRIQKLIDEEFGRIDPEDWL